MQLQTNLVRRKSHFYFRTRIPTDLKSHYGKTEILISLKTSDKRIADSELAKLKVKLYAEVARLRGDNFGMELTPSNSHNQSKDTTVPDVEHYICQTAFNFIMWFMLPNIECLIFIVGIVSFWETMN